MLERKVTVEWGPCIGFYRALWFGMHAWQCHPSFGCTPFFSDVKRRPFLSWRRKSCAACAKMADGCESNACVGTRGEREREMQVRNDQTSPCNPSPFPCSSSSAAAAAWRRLRRCHTTVKLLLLQLLTGNCALLECWYKCRATLCMAVCSTLLFQKTPVNLSHFKCTYDFI